MVSLDELQATTGTVNDSPSVFQVERDVLEQIRDQTVIGLDALAACLTQHSWNQIFHAVDRLARQGKVVLRRHGFEYTIFSTHYAA